MSDYSTPKENWVTSDGIFNTDLNRIETNTRQNHADLFRGCGEYKHGFEFQANSVAGTSVLVVKPGNCLSIINEGNIELTSQIVKIFDTNNWVAGSGPTVPCKLAGLTYSTNKWWYVFVIKNPSTGVVDIVVDENINGANIVLSSMYTTSGFTLFQRIGYLKTSSFLPGVVTIHGLNGRFWLGNLPDPRTSNFTLYAGQGQTSRLWTCIDAQSVQCVPDDLPCNVGAYWYVETGEGKVWSTGLNNSPQTVASNYVGHRVVNDGYTEYAIDANGQFYYFHNQAVIGAEEVIIRPTISWFEERDVQVLL